MTGHTGEGFALEFSSDYIISGSKDTTVKVWAKSSFAKTMTADHTLNFHTKEVYDVTFSKD
jgi:WD40 repeat protein